MNTQRKQKLELVWVGKETWPKLEPRVLLEDSTKSYHAEKRVTDNDLFDNRLVYGDNLLALKSLEQELTGRVKCVFTDHCGLRLMTTSAITLRCYAMRYLVGRALLLT